MEQGLDKTIMPKSVQVIECPRDAIQGWKKIIPTSKKIEYYNSLLKVGFDTIDFGSFVSPKAVPQMADTEQVLKKMDPVSSGSRLLAIVANVRGAEIAMAFDQISFLGFPFSISPTFQLRNTNSTINESFKNVEIIQKLCAKHKKILVVYLSMAFGNPYGDRYNESILMEWADRMKTIGITIVSLADTIGVASPAQITYAIKNLIPDHPELTIGLHLHSRHDTWKEKMEAAFNAGCKRYDGALKGIGGCPMAQDELVGNLNTENIIHYLDSRSVPTGINKEALKESLHLASALFGI